MSEFDNYVDGLLCLIANPHILKSSLRVTFDQRGIPPQTHVLRISIGTQATLLVPG